MAGALRTGANASWEDGLWRARLLTLPRPPTRGPICAFEAMKLALIAVTCFEDRPIRDEGWGLLSK